MGSSIEANLEKMQNRQSFSNHWHTDLMDTIIADPLYCMFATFCYPCASYLLRRRALYNDMTRYTCCAGYMPCSGKCGEPNCPEFCLCTEVFFCFGNSVASTRFLLQDEFNIQTTKCDNCIIGFMICVQQLACIFSIIALITGSEEINEASHLLNCLAHLVNCVVCACMQTQHKIELDKRDGKFGHGEVMSVPAVQQMSRVDEAVPPQVMYPPAQASYGQQPYRPMPYGDVPPTPHAQGYAPSPHAHPPLVAYPPPPANHPPPLPYPPPANLAGYPHSPVIYPPPANPTAYPPPSNKVVYPPPAIANPTSHSPPTKPAGQPTSYSPPDTPPNYPPAANSVSHPSAPSATDKSLSPNYPPVENPVSHLSVPNAADKSLPPNYPPAENSVSHSSAPNAADKSLPPNYPPAANPVSHPSAPNNAADKSLPPNPVSHPPPSNATASSPTLANPNHVSFAESTNIPKGDVEPSSGSEHTKK